MDIILENLEKIYKIEKELGRGGMGVVYLATDKRLDRRVAIKVLSLSGSNSSEVSTTEVIERFQREAKAVAKLAHPNIVSIHDIGDENDFYYMVMEFVDGKMISDLSSGAPMDPSMVINIAIQVCNALDFAHESGIIHRDIKPANIILSKKGIAKLMDFGIAQLGGTEESYKLTQAGSVLGSILYISPEQLNNASEVDARADIYSLGISLYELLTGFLPFMSESISKVIMRILTEMPEPASKYNPMVTPGLDAIINKSLAKSADDRYQTAGEMARDLAALLNEPGYNASNLNFAFGDENIALPGVTPTISGNFSNSNISNNPMAQASVKKTFINEALMETLDKDYYWLKTLINSWETEKRNFSTVNETINFVTNQSTNELFSGAVIIDNNILIFIYDSYCLGAINLTDNSLNEDVFDNLTDRPDKIEIKRIIAEQKHITAVIASMFSYEKPFYLNLDSSGVDLVPLIDNFSSENAPFTGYAKCYFETNIFYYGYSYGNQLFSTCVDEDDDTISPTVYNDLKKLIASYGILFNTYTIKPNLIGPTIKEILKQVTINLKYREYTKSELSHIAELGNDEIPNYLLKEVKQNVYLDLVLNQSGKIKIIDKEIDVANVITNSINYKFSEWLINDYFYQLNTTGNATTLKLNFLGIPGIETIKFFDVLEGEDNNKYSFSVVFYGKLKGEHSSKTLFVVRIGNGDKSDINKFIDDTTQVKKKFLKTGDIVGAFYVSTTNLTPDIIRIFSERTVEPKKGFILSLDASAKFKGFVKLASGKGYHLNFIEFDEQNNSFKVIAPTL